MGEKSSRGELGKLGSKGSRGVGEQQSGTWAAGNWTAEAVAVAVAATGAIEATIEIANVYSVCVRTCVCVCVRA